MSRQFTMQRGKTRVVFAAGASARVLEEIEAIGAQRVAVVCTARRRAEAAELASRLGGRGAGVVPLAREHVPVETVAEARLEIERSEADTVLAFGGGSAIGLAKALAEYDGKKLVNAMGADVKVPGPDEAKNVAEQAAKDYAVLLAVAKQALGDKVREVKMSSRLVARV